MSYSLLARFSLCLLALSCWLASDAAAVDVNGTFTLDNSSSSVLIDIAALGGSDNDTTPVSGTITSQFSFDTSGGTPLITGVNFTGGRIAADNTTIFDVPVLGFANLHIESTGIAGFISTPTPPGSISSQGGGNLSYTFNAADHSSTFNEGIINVSDFQVATINLADLNPPITGAGPSSPNATINLTQGVTHHNLTQFNAQLTLPVSSTGLVPVDESNDATVTATGTLVANGLFNVDIGLTGTRELIFPGDPILAIDLDGGSASASPGGEGPENVVDGTAALKHVNLAGSNSGFIVTPSAGAAQVQSMRFTSANDFPERDPATWELYGTNDSILSMNHSLGTAENWTLIDSGNTDIPDNRLTAGTVVSVANVNTYSSYKMIFPTTKNLNDPVLHLAEAEFFSTTDGTGSDLLGAASSILAIDEDFVPNSSYPGNENPANAIDDDSATKYLNFGDKNSGLIVTPSVGSSIVDSFQITTANDAPLRDPAAWEIYGTNDAISSTDNSLGDGENWTLIDGGTFSATEVPETRFTTGDLVSVANSAAFTSYRVAFTDLRDTNDPIMQIGDIQLFGDLASSFMPGDFDQDGDVDATDFLTWQRGLGTTYDASDFVDWQNNYEGVASPVASASTVPEPGSIALVLSMALLITVSPSSSARMSS